MYMIQGECDRRKQNRQPVHRGRMNVKQDNMEKAFSVVEGENNVIDAYTL